MATACQATNEASILRLHDGATLLRRCDVFALVTVLDVERWPSQGLLRTIVRIDRVGKGEATAKCIIETPFRVGRDGGTIGVCFSRDERALVFLRRLREQPAFTLVGHADGKLPIQVQPNGKLDVLWWPSRGREPQNFDAHAVITGLLLACHG